jgi:hypothetical protein
MINWRCIARSFISARPDDQLTMLLRSAPENSVAGIPVIPFPYSQFLPYPQQSLDVQRTCIFHGARRHPTNSLQFEWKAAGNPSSANPPWIDRAMSVPTNSDLKGNLIWSENFRLNCTKPSAEHSWPLLYRLWTSMLNLNDGIGQYHFIQCKFPKVLMQEFSRCWVWLTIFLVRQRKHIAYNSELEDMYISQCCLSSLETRQRVQYFPLLQEGTTIMSSYMTEYSLGAKA